VFRVDDFKFSLLFIEEKELFFQIISVKGFVDTDLHFEEMADDLTSMWGKFSLTEEEDVELSFRKVELQDGVTFGQACVLGKLLSDRMVSKEKIRQSLEQWWLPEESISFKVLGENLFLIEFTNPKDKERVLEGRPWVFEGSLFLVEDFDGSKAPSQFTFDRAAFWVRMIDLPLACMGRDIGNKIGASMGVVEAVDTDARGMGWGEFLRVKVQIDLSKPLARGRKINIEGTAHWIKFQYERLPKFCFQCGSICHGKTGCPKRSNFRQQDMSQYGPWLRAPSPPRRTERGPSRHALKKGPNISSHSVVEEYYSHGVREGRSPTRGATRFYGMESSHGRNEGRWNNSDEAVDSGKERDGAARIFSKNPNVSTAWMEKGAKEGMIFGSHKENSKRCEDLAEGRRNNYGKHDTRGGKRASAVFEMHGAVTEIFSQNGKAKEGIKEGSKDEALGVKRGAKKRKSYTSNKGLGDWLISPTPRVEVKAKYSGPILADVEKSMQAAEVSSEKVSKLKESEFNGKRKLRDADDDLETMEPPSNHGKIWEVVKNLEREMEEQNKEVYVGNKNGSGMAEAVEEQPRRPI
jgi:hypothetical protein